MITFALFNSRIRCCTCTHAGRDNDALLPSPEDRTCAWNAVIDERLCPVLLSVLVLRRLHRSPSRITVNVVGVLEAGRLPLCHANPSEQELAVAFSLDKLLERRGEPLDL